MAQLPVRLLRPRWPGHGRQAAAGAVGAGRERQAVRLLPPQPAAPRGDHRRALRRGAVLGDQPPPRPLGRGRGRAHAGRVPLVRRRLARERRRPPADPAADPRLRHRAARVRNRPLAHAVVVRRARRARLQHEDARRLPRRPSDRARLPSLRPRLDSTADRTARGRRRGDARHLVRVDRARRTHPRRPAPLRRQLGQRHRARPDVRIQRLRARRRPGRRPGPGARPPRRLRARRAPTRGQRRRPRRRRRRIARPRRRPNPGPPRRPRRLDRRARDRADDEHRTRAHADARAGRHQGQGKEPDSLRRPSRPPASVPHRPRRSGRLDDPVRALRAARNGTARAPGPGRPPARCTGRTAAHHRAAGRRSAAPGPAGSPPRPAPGGAARAGEGGSQSRRSC